MSERGRHKIHNLGAGKGSSPRPVNLKEFGKRFDAIFRKKGKR